MAIITLTTDLGLKDHYVGVVKGTILKQCPSANIVDITHEIPPFNLLQAAFTLKNCYLDFPEGTIHIIGVNPDNNSEVNHLALEFNGHYFIGSDNGIFSLIFDEKPSRIFELNIISNEEYFTFPTKEIFCKAACHIANGGTLELIGKPTTEILERTLFRAVSVGDIIKGMVIHIDHYGNIITNIEQTFFKAFRANRDFVIEFRDGNYDINRFSNSYSDVAEGEKLALFSSSRLMEIAINKGNASKLLGIKNLDTIRIRFNDR
jgi:S-adenosylmethionine hydrolase